MVGPGCEDTGREVQDKIVVLYVSLRHTFSIFFTFFPHVQKLEDSLNFCVKEDPREKGINASR